LSKSFKGVITPRHIREICLSEWKQMKYNRMGSGGASTSGSSTTTEGPTPVSDYDKQFVQVHEEKE
jgi:hypothetical protein